MITGYALNERPVPDETLILVTRVPQEMVLLSPFYSLQVGYHRDCTLSPSSAKALLQLCFRTAGSPINSLASHLRDATPLTTLNPIVGTTSLVFREAHCFQLQTPVYERIQVHLALSRSRSTSRTLIVHRQEIRILERQLVV